jgi:endoglycosylceramidase
VGTQIVDQGNHPVRLLSAGIAGMDHGTGAAGGRGACSGWSTPDPTAYATIGAWGFNSVRLAISWANLEPTPPDAMGVHRYNQAYLAAVDAIVKAFAAHGVATVLDMHQGRWSPAFRDLTLYSGATFCRGAGMPVWLYPNGGGQSQMVAAERSFFEHPGAGQQGFVDAWTMLAKRYAGNHMVVGADLLNEGYDLLTAPYPGVSGLRPSDLDLKGFYERVGAAVHAANPHLLLIFEENLSRSSNILSLTGKPDLPNAVYSAHFYQNNWAPDGAYRMKVYSRRARSWNLPFWVGEFRTFGYTSHQAPVPGWEGDVAAFTRFCKQNDIGWAVWSYNTAKFPPTGSGLESLLRTGY